MGGEGAQDVTEEPTVNGERAVAREPQTAWRIGGLPRGSFRLPEGPRPRLVPATSVSADAGEDLFAVAMLLACAAVGAGRPALVCEASAGGERRAGLFSTAVSRALAEMVAARYADLSPKTRGGVCLVGLPDEPDDRADRLEGLAAALPVSTALIAALGPDDFRALIERPEPAIDSVVVCADLPRERSLAALVCGELSDRGIRCRVWKRPPGGMGRAAALSGWAPPGRAGEEARRMIRGLGLAEAGG